MLQTSDTLLPGTILHGRTYDYEIVKVLGQGSFGITYLASAKIRGELGALDFHVTIKEFFMRDINGRENSMVTSSKQSGIYDKYKQKFIKEAQNLSKLNHEYIIKVMESFETNNTVYYVMEYLNEGSLDDYIAKRGGLSEQETLAFAHQIATALSFMHSRNMLHLDLKPGNVMLKNGKTVLIDFGLSKQYDEAGNPESSTTIGGGTPGYAPIEQLNYKGEHSDRLPATMDIYALGGTMFKMLTGHRPPDATKIFNDGFPKEELQARGVSEATIQLITLAMSPSQRSRIATTEVFCQALLLLFNKEEAELKIENKEVEVIEDDIKVVERPIKQTPVNANRVEPQPQREVVNSDWDFVPISTIKRVRPLWVYFVIIPILLPLFFIGLCFFMIGIHDNPFAIFIGGAIWFICLKYFLYLFPFPGIKRIFKGVDFIESNLNANNGYPLVMGNHCYGVYDKRKAKVILQPKYDSIRWVIPSKVVAGTLNGKEYFFDKNGKKLSNIPQSYYNR